MKNVAMAWMVAMMGLACAGGTTGSTTGTSGQTGGSCSGPQDCPGGFACRARACVASCTSSTPVTGGCVVGASCVNGNCVNNTSCSENVDCAFDKGEVCNFVSGTCVAAANSCTEGENETLCGNGFLCHVKVCYENCAGSKGCPAAQTCSASHTCQ